jgi:hypothetical protein
MPDQHTRLLAEILNRLTAIEQTLVALGEEIKAMALDITNLQKAVANETTVEQSAITLISGLAAQIQTLINNSGNTVDPAALQKLVDSMTASQAALAAAVTANTTSTTTSAAPAVKPK